MTLPSGDQAGVIPSLLNCRWLVPSTFITRSSDVHPKIEQVEPRLNAIWVPSGDQAGPAPRTSMLRAPLARSRISIMPEPVLYAICFPSGDQAGELSLSAVSV